MIIYGFIFFNVEDCGILFISLNNVLKNEFKWKGFIGGKREKL